MAQIETYFPELKERRRAELIVEYLAQQKNDHGALSLNLYDDSALAYLKHAWNDEGAGHVNCEDVKQVLPFLLGRLLSVGLIQRIEIEEDRKNGIPKTFEWALENK